MTKVAFFETVTSIFEIVGVAAMVLGFVGAIVLGIRSLVVTRDGRVAFKTLRDSIGLVILLGLEILVAGDLIRTVAVEPTLDNVIVLGLIVLIRTFLSFSLEIEINGVPPWRRALVSGATVIKKAATADDGQ